MKILTGIATLAVAFLSGAIAAHLLFACILPWRKAAETTHITWIFAGMQFTGWNLLAPLFVFVFACAGFAWLGVRTLRP